tara:strand:+ start:1342 stop:2154 length:813 start_codon:yes stop_codon:yes gene_type:complete
MDFVSIIVPFFNASKTIKSTLESILNQTFEQFECILIDDGSTDNSFSIVSGIISRDKRFKLYQQSNNGVVSARNLGIKKSKGRFITFLDADDIWDPNFLRESLLVRKKSNKPIPITHCSYIRFSFYKEKIIYSLVHPPKIINYKNILKKNFMPLLTVLIDRKIISNFFFEDKRPEDYKLWVNLIYLKRYKSISIGKELAYYRVSKNQRSKNKFIAFIRIYYLFSQLPNNNLIRNIYNSLNWIIYNSIQRLNPKKNINKEQLDFLNSLKIK